MDELSCSLKVELNCVTSHQFNKVSLPGKSKRYVHCLKCEKHFTSINKVLKCQKGLNIGPREFPQNHLLTVFEVLCKYLLHQERAKKTF